MTICALSLPQPNNTHRQLTILKFTNVNRDSQIQTFSSKASYALMRSFCTAVAELRNNSHENSINDPSNSRLPLMAALLLNKPKATSLVDSAGQGLPHAADEATPARRQSIRRDLSMSIAGKVTLLHKLYLSCTHLSVSVLSCCDFTCA